MNGGRAMADARFEDGAEQPLRLIALDDEGLQVIASLAQDAVLTSADLRYDRKARQFGLLINRFRWEDRAAAERDGRPYERVRAALVFDDVVSVRSLGIARGDKDVVLSLLSISFTPGPDGTGRVTLTLAGDGAIDLEVEAIEAALTDVARPHRAVSGKIPRHD